MTTAESHVPTPAAPRRARSRWFPALAVAATLAAAAGAAQAGDVRWRLGLDLPLPPLPGVVVRPAPVYAPPPVVYAPPPSYGYGYGYDDGPRYAPPPEVVRYERPRYRHRDRVVRYVEPVPVYVQPRIVYRSPPPPPPRRWERGWY
jgi:hypothetical protein